jgi:aminoglycoside phosphotransferase (APT) family kinase protein
MMQPSAELDAIRPPLAAWLGSHVPGWSDVQVTAVAFAGGAGFSADILLTEISLTLNGERQQRSLVVRRQPQSFEVVFGSDLTLQARMMAALDARGDVPVPAWVGMETDPAVLGSPFLVMGRVHGQAVTQRPNYNVQGWVADFTPAQRGRTWANAIEAFAKLHAIDWRDGFTFLDRPDRGKPGLDQYLAALTEWHAAVGEGRPMPIADAALAYVHANRPADADVCVLWGDPTPSNVMFKPDGTVAALIDWELAALGPPELDLAWWMYFDDLFSRRFGVTRLEGLPTPAETIAIYEKAAGRTVRHMAYYDIVAGLRMALVAAGAFNRQVGIGNIAADNKSLNANLMTLYLAERLGLELPELGPDFVQFMRNLTPVEEKAN